MTEPNEYFFHPELKGTGETRDAAWLNAIEALAADPGEPPDPKPETFCPKCQSPVTKSNLKVHVEEGEYDYASESYEAEGEADHYKCSQCGYGFIEWGEYGDLSETGDVVRTYYVQLVKEYIQPDKEPSDDVNDETEGLYGIIPVEAANAGLALLEVKDRLDRRNIDVLQSTNPDIRWDSPLPDEWVYVDFSFDVTGQVFPGSQRSDLEEYYSYNHSEVTDQSEPIENLPTWSISEVLGEINKANPIPDVDSL